MTKTTMERDPDTGKFLEQPDSLAKPTAVRFPKDTKEDLIDLAKSQGKSKSQVVTEALEYWIKYHKENGESPS